MIHDLLLTLHVIGWVFWLGTDLGVFYAAKAAERSDLGAEARLTVLQLGMLLDRAPRFAVPVVWGSGALLAAGLGYPLLPTAAVLGISLAWIVATACIIFAAPGSAAQRTGLHVQTAFYAAVIIGMGAGGAWQLSTGAIPLWLAIKWFAFVAVAVFALRLESRFAPVADHFQTLAVSGADPDLNQRIHSSLQPVYTLVLGIYASTLVAGVSGLLKPVW